MTIDSKSKKEKVKRRSVFHDSRKKDKISMRFKCTNHQNMKVCPRTKETQGKERENQDNGWQEKKKLQWKKVNTPRPRLEYTTMLASPLYSKGDDDRRWQLYKPRAYLPPLSIRPPLIHHRPLYTPLASPMQDGCIRLSKCDQRALSLCERGSLLRSCRSDEEKWSALGCQDNEHENFTIAMSISMDVKSAATATIT